MMVFFALLGLVISLGPYLTIGNLKFPILLKLLYQIPIVDKFIRIPGRFFVLTNFAVAIICAHGYSHLEERFRRKHWLLAGICIIFLVENIEFRTYAPDHRSVVSVPTGYAALPIKNNQLLILAELPSSLFTDNGYVNDISEFSREYRYQYWQISHKQNTVNGSASYFPLVRMKNNELLKNVTLNSNLDLLIDSNHVDFLIYHKGLELNASELEILGFLRQSPRLTDYHEDDRMVIFKTE
jgi:hypothetical protein